MSQEEDLQHRSQVFSKLLTKLGYSNIASAISSADIGILGGAPRNPDLKPGKGSESSYVRYAEGQYSYTMIQLQTELLCRVCGKWQVEYHKFELHHAEDGVKTLGFVRMCRQCQKDSWLFTSPHAQRRRGP